MNFFLTLFLVLTCAAFCIHSQRLFFRGRPRGKHGLLGAPKRTNLSKDLPKAQWMRQRLNHFNPVDTRTWKQRYFVSDKSFKPGSPVFLQLGGEGTADPVWLVEAQIASNYAPRFNALSILLEHRYYGESHPTGDMSTENLQYLTSEQALADAAAFIDYYKQLNPLVNESKWIVFGGSYSGSLAAWMRLKYPHLVAGAVASSAPMKAIINFKDYLAVVRNSLGSTCDAAINDATRQLAQLLANQEKWPAIGSTFNTCDRFDGRFKNDVSNFVESLAGNFEGVVQYNKDNRDFEKVSGSNITIDTICAIMTNELADSALTRYAAVNKLILDVNEQNCLDYKYDKFIKSMREIEWNSSAAEGGRQWTYQTCVEFGFFQSSDLRNQPFGHFFPVEFFEKQCKDIFGPKFNLDFLRKAIKYTNTNYGGYNVKLTNVVLPNGSIDPWHALGLIHYNYSSSKSVFIQGTAHCADMYPDSPLDPDELKNARNEIAEYIGFILKS
ncbi:putative serine protease K12H4.7-like protein [Dinothrombium tinctorium]|uniref:Putative serine protease K12H4.7-like protein n=1 Tax=Dinothrombium tinctorium TaxID=1965070 RepID=A0A443RGI1_9ACAR|nr:putative serine protease K12H4.7-like protein [Dinothrombium tinctorium]